MLPSRRLKEIRRRLDHVTPGPWRHGSLSADVFPAWPMTEVIGSEEVDPSEIPGLPPLDGSEGCRVTHTFTLIQPYQHVTGHGEREQREWTDWLCRCEADARFFAHAPEDMRVLLAEVHRLRARLAVLEGGAEGAC